MLALIIHKIVESMVHDLTTGVETMHNAHRRCKDCAHNLRRYNGLELWHCNARVYGWTLVRAYKEASLSKYFSGPLQMCSGLHGYRHCFGG